MMRGMLAAAIVAFSPTVMAADASSPVPPGPICGDHAPETAAAPEASILTGYGTGGFRVRTSGARAQAFFDNGMQLGHAFAHRAAISAFQEAEKLDPGCAMCAWGEAWARGPTINYPIDAKAQAELAVVADHAAALARDGPQVERELTAALRRRYHNGGRSGPGDDAFARAMDAIARDHPDDNELAILAADAWMIPTSAHPPSRQNLDKALRLLEGALGRNPDDTGAIHFYIHATEMDGVAAKALPYAEKLERLAPSASHLVHMPSHTYFWTGRYSEAVASNLDAVAVDEANARRLKLGGDPFSLVYHGHNIAFGIGAAMMDGDGASALELARPQLAQLSRTRPQDQSGLNRAYFAEGRYAGQAEVAALPDPGAGLPFARAMWRYARGEAAARRGDAGATAAEAQQVRLSAQELSSFGENAPLFETLARIARLTLEGRAAMLDHRPANAMRAFAEAAGLQEIKLATYTDPPAWWQPVRRSLAEAELAAGRPADAERDARTVLARWPDDPLTLAALARAEQAQGRADEAQQHLASARRGWKGDPRAVGPAGA
jgi:hypothetical protein